MLIRSVFVGTALRGLHIAPEMKYRVYSQLCVGLAVQVTEYLSASDTGGGSFTQVLYLCAVLFYLYVMYVFPCYIYCNACYQKRFVEGA